VDTVESLVVVHSYPQNAEVGLVARDIGCVGAVERVHGVLGREGPGGVRVDLARIDRRSVAEQVGLRKVGRRTARVGALQDLHAGGVLDVIGESRPRDGDRLLTLGVTRRDRHAGACPRNVGQFQIGVALAVEAVLVRGFLSN